MDNKEMEMKELDLDEMVKVTGGVLNPAEKDFSEFWEKMVEKYGGKDTRLYLNPEEMKTLAALQKECRKTKHFAIYCGNGQIG